MTTRTVIAAWANDTQRRVAAGEIDLRDWGALMNNRWDQDFPAAVLEVLAEPANLQPELKDNSAFRAGRQLLIEGGEIAIDMIANGNFYEDHDASTEALGDLRSLLAVVKETIRGDDQIDPSDVLSLTSTTGRGRKILRKKFATSFRTWRK